MTVRKIRDKMVSWAQLQSCNLAGNFADVPSAGLQLSTSFL